MAAVAPAQQATRLEDDDVDMDGSEVDAEGEEEVEMEYDMAPAGMTSSNAAAFEANKSARKKRTSGSEDEERSDAEEAQSSDEEASGAEDQDKEDGLVGPVKMPKGADLDSDAEMQEDDEQSSDNDSEPSDASSGSVAVEDWEDASAGEGEADATSRNNCIFCKQDEENDPGEEFEEYLACSVCGDNAHRHCARHADSLTPDTEAEDWRCPQCVSNSLAPGEDQDDQEDDEEQESEHEALTRRLSTSSRLTRDLLPAPRGGSKPGAHSIFSTLIVEDDPLDGSRALRKRKSSEGTDTLSKTSSKRRKKSADDASSASRASSVSGDESGKKAETAVSGPSRRRVANTQTSVTSKPSDFEEPARLSRPRRQKSEAPRVRPLVRDSRTFRIAIRVDLSKIKDKPPKKSRRPMTATSSNTRFVGASASHFQSPFYPMHDREIDESKIKPYGGILSETEADTSKTFPTPPDRARFEEARQRAEEEWKIKTAASEAEQETKGRASQKISGPPSKIKCINFGGYEIDTWYAAPYPEEYSRNRVLYICEFCLKYMPSDYVAWRHKLKCPAKHPPGDEIYRHSSVSVFEVDGRKNPVYCQNLCLLAKLFLGSKTLYYDVEPFLFYIMTEYDDLGYHFVGYFSKEKRPSSMNNVSCILTLPIHQRKGYGNLLIDFSYLLTRVEQKTGSPEKPLSDMGLVSYRNYWRLQLAYKLINREEILSIAKLSDLTGMTADDLIAALEALRALVRDPVTKTYALRLDHAFLKETIDKWEAKQYVKLNEDALIWTPYVMGQYNLNSYDRGGISTVAPREDEEENVVPEEGVQQQESAEANILMSKINGENSEVMNAPFDSDADLAITARINNANATLDTPASPPKTNGIYAASLTKTSPQQEDIPPTRYEIFPPLPKDQLARRRPGRGGNRRPTYTPASHMIRRERSRNGNTTPRTNGISPRHITTPTSRKTRSALGQEHELANPDGAGKDKQEDDQSDEELAVRSKSRATNGNANGKGKEKARTRSTKNSRQTSRRNSTKLEEDEDEDAIGEDEDDDNVHDNDEGHESDPESDEADADADAEPEADPELEEGENDGDFEPEDDAYPDVDEDAVEVEGDEEAASASEAESEEDAEGEPDGEAESEEDADGESDPDAAGEEVEMIDT